MMPNRIVILGGAGFLASKFKEYSKFDQSELFFFSQTKGDYQAEKLETLSKLLNSVSPTHVLNFCAFTNVDGCEKNARKAYMLNAELPQALSSWATDSKYILHISTDQVYNSNASKEEDVSISNVYGATKFLGDMALKGKNNAVLRTNFVGKSNEKQVNSFSDWIFNSALSHSHVSLFQDVFFNPLHVSTLSKIIDTFIDTKPSGIFNAGSEGKISKAEFALKFLENLSLELGSFELVNSSNFETRARRPFDMTMDVTKLSQFLNFDLPSIHETITILAGEYKCLTANSKLVKKL